MSRVLQGVNKNSTLLNGLGVYPSGDASIEMIGDFRGVSTLRDIINAYQTDPDSSYHKLRFGTRRNHDALLARIMAGYGDLPLADIKARTILGWHRIWSDDGQKVAMGHSFIGQLRTLFSFGKTLLEDADCARLSDALSSTRFASPKPRTERMTADQCIAIRKVAHSFGWPSIALAQAFQFELMLRQKDVIGEWVPRSEPGFAEIDIPLGKWMSGITWQEIDENMILRHVTSKRGKALEVDLKLAPMVMEEIGLYGKHYPTGPVIICDTNGLPWRTSEYRRKWRIVADAAGIPASVKNMDSRAGGITEATDAGADLEMVRHAATHSNISMTQRYSRGSTEKVAEVMARRVAYREAKGG